MVLFSDDTRVIVSNPNLTNFERDINWYLKEWMNGLVWTCFPLIFVNLNLCSC